MTEELSKRSHMKDDHDFASCGGCVVVGSYWSGTLPMHQVGSESDFQIKTRQD